VKSMLGEELAEADVAERGLAGDRAYALLAAATGRVVSAKNPKRWPRMFQLRASYVSRPSPGGPLPAVRIEFPDGTEVESGGPETEERLSGFLGGKVRLVTSTPERAAVEEYTPPIPGLEEGFGEFQIPPGPFHDSTPVHVVTTATLARLRDRYPEGRFDVRRFRPNVLLETDGQAGFVEQSWIGRTLAIGDVRIPLTKPCSRCVMTTLPQDDLAEDIGILRAIVASAHGDVGVKGPVGRGGVVHREDPVFVE